MVANAGRRLDCANRGRGGQCTGGDRLHLRSTKGAARRATLGAQGSGGDLSVWCCPPRSGHMRIALLSGGISGYFIGLGPLFSR